MNKETSKDLKKIGIGLILFGFAPTPDDVTVISPIVQIVGGATLWAIGEWGS